MSDPVTCGSCGGSDVRSYPIEDVAKCQSCGYRYLGLPRNKHYARDWTGNEYENAELYRDA